LLLARNLMTLRRPKVDVDACAPAATHLYTGWAKNGPFLNVDNFAMVSGRKAYYMSKVCKFCLAKSIKLA